MVRRRREVQAYYGSAQSDRSRLPFLLEPPAPANAFASMVSRGTLSLRCVKPLAVIGCGCGWIHRTPETKFGFTSGNCGGLGACYFQAAVLIHRQTNLCCRIRPAFYV
jgi:hypothetical protein